MKTLLRLSLLLSATALADEQPETKALFISPGKINLVHSLFRPFARKIPRTFTKHTHYHSHAQPHAPPSLHPYPAYPYVPGQGYVPSQTPTGALTLDETLAGDERFTTLVAALAVAFDDNSDILNGTSPLTIFAPTDSAFAKVDNSTLEGLLQDPEALRGVLTRHLVANKAVRWGTKTQLPA